MQLPQTLLSAIESAHVAYEGLSHPLRVVDVEWDRAQASRAETVTVTVETAHEGVTRRAHCRFTRDELDEAPAVVATLAGAMRAALARAGHDS